jgi:hypothetical protein
MTCTRPLRLAYAFVGLVAGDAALLLHMLLNACLASATLLAAHAGEPFAQVAVAIQVFAFYAALSLVGWLFVGVPVVLLLPAQRVSGWPWPLVIILGAFLGPPAMLVILFVVSGGRMDFARTDLLFIYSILVSTVSFAVYVALLKNHFRGSS